MKLGHQPSHGVWREMVPCITIEAGSSSLAVSKYVLSSTQIILENGGHQDSMLELATGKVVPGSEMHSLESLSLRLKRVSPS